jgi:sigma-B regulation protein RsbU (phosphoserine phosphatase)
VFEVEWEGRTARLVSLIDLTDRKHAERVAVARGVQRAFLPERADLRWGELEGEALNELCEDASGDFYDYFPLDDGRLAVAVGDVTGHGLGSALLMCQGRAFLRAFCLGGFDPAGVLGRMNDALDDSACQGTFLTLFLGFLHPETGVLAWSSAGHVPALIRRASTGRVEVLRATAPPLWAVPGVDVPPGSPTRLDPGDVLLLCSDGATEAIGPKEHRFGLERLAGALASGPPRPRGLVPHVRATLRAWTGPGPIHDDLTLLAVRRFPAGEAPAPAGAPAPSRWPPPRP